MPLHSFRHFSGNAAALCDAALACAHALGLPLSEDKTGERVVRYYVAEGVIDRPERLGRDAAYNFRHLLQFLTARRMAEAGIALSVVARHNAAATTRALEDGLSRPVPTAAQILVRGFLGADGAGARSSPGKPPAPASPARTTAASQGRPQFALPDVLEEMRQMTRTVLKRLDSLERRATGPQSEPSALTDRVMQLTAQLEHLTRELHAVTRQQADLAREHTVLLQRQQHLQHQLEHDLARLATADHPDPINPKGPKR